MTLLWVWLALLYLGLVKKKVVFTMVNHWFNAQPGEHSWCWVTFGCKLGLLFVTIFPDVTTEPHSDQNDWRLKKCSETDYVGSSGTERLSFENEWSEVLNFMQVHKAHDIQTGENNKFTDHCRSLSRCRHQSVVCVHNGISTVCVAQL